MMVALVIVVYGSLYSLKTVDGVIVVRLLACVSAIFLALVLLLKNKSISDSSVESSEGRFWHLYSDGISYGLPLLMTGILSGLIEYADRFILKHYFDYETLAGYVVYIKVAAVLNPLIVTPFGLWWPTERFRRLEDEDGGREFFRSTSRRLLTVFLLLGGWLWFLSRPLLTWFAPGVAQDDSVIFLLISSVVFMGMEPSMNIGLLNAGKTHHNVYGALFGAIIHIVACFCFIPPLGITGAAVATALSYLCYTLFLNYLSQRVHKVNFDYAGMGLMLMLAATLIIMTINLASHKDSLFRLSMLFIYTVLILATYYIYALRDKKLLARMYAS